MLRKILNFGVGYLIAVVVAVVAAEFILLAPTVLPDDGKFGSFYRQIQDLPGMLFIGFVYTFVTAIPGYIATLYVASRYQAHTVRLYVVGGMLTAVLAHLLMSLFVGAFLFSAYIVFVCSVPGGAVGAYAYYRWRRMLLISWGVDPEGKQQ